MLSRHGHRRHDGSWWFGLKQFGGSDSLMMMVSSVERKWRRSGIYPDLNWDGNTRLM